MEFLTPSAVEILGRDTRSLTDRRLDANYSRVVLKAHKFNPEWFRISSVQMLHILTLLYMATLSIYNRPTAHLQALVMARITECHTRHASKLRDNKLRCIQPCFPVIDVISPTIPSTAVEYDYGRFDSHAMHKMH